MGDYMMYIWIAVMIALFYFMLIRPQKKKERADRLLRNSLQPGDQIITIGGFTGRVLNVKDDEVVFETGAAKTKLTVKKWAIQTRIPTEQSVPAPVPAPVAEPVVDTTADTVIEPQVDDTPDTDSGDDGSDD